MAERDLVVRFIGDDRDLQRAFTSASQGSKKFNRDVGVASSRFDRLNQTSRGFLSGFSARTSLLFGSGQFVAAAAISASLAKSIQAASDLNEQISKSEQVFGSASAAVKAWSSTTASSIGVAREEALAAAGTFGNLFKTVSIVPSSAALMSQALVQLAADLASFNNVSITDSLTAIRSGLVGEAEPLRRFGVLLSEARVQQQAMADSGKTSAKALTEQEKALARYEIIMRDTTTAQGDFARTSDGLANQTRILQAQLKDLAANMGTTLLPVVLRLTEALNALFVPLAALNKSPFGKKLALEGISLHKLIEARDRIAEIKGETDLLVVALDKAIKRLAEVDKPGRRPTAGPGGPGDLPGKIAEIQAAARRRSALAASRAERKAQSAFDAFTKGMGLKLDKAKLTQSLNDDLAALRELERGIQRRIATEGKTFALVDQLTRVRQAIADILSQQTADAAQAASDAYNETIEALSLKLDIAKATKGFNDDLAALRLIEDTILARIKAEGRTTDLLRQLFENRQEQADTLRRARSAEQFDILGLTAEGQKRTPGSRALLRRARSLQQQVKNTPLDTAKTRQQLQNIVRVLTGAFGKAGKDVRDAILGMLNDISDALEGRGTKRGPLTKTSGLNTRKILEGLGLTPQQERELRDRLAHFNTAGVKLTGAPTGTRTTGGFGGGTGFVIENNVTVEIDGKKITSTVTREQQKTRRRNPLQKRGPHRAGTGGH